MGTPMAHEAGNTFTTIREIFHPITLFGGAQYAACLSILKVKGRLYLLEDNQWSWRPLSGEEPRTLTDWELEELLSPLDVCRTLLCSAQDVMIDLLRQIDCLSDSQARACALAGVIPGNCYENIIIREVFRLRGGQSRDRSVLHG